MDDSGIKHVIRNTLKVVMSKLAINYDTPWKS